MKNSLFRRLLSTLFKISDRFEKLLRHPFRQPAKKESFFQKLIGWVTKSLGLLLGLFVLALSFPFTLFSVFSKQQRREFFRGLPALLMFVFITLTVSRSIFQGSAVAEKYRNKAATALTDENYELAKTYLDRIVRGKHFTDNDKFNWAISMLQTGEADRGLAIIDQLAPDSEPGFNLAHRFKALQLSQLEDRVQQADISKLKFHLEQAKGASGLDKAWSVYYLAINQKQEAANHLREAVNDDPQLWVSVAELYRQMEQPSRYQQTLKESKSKLKAFLLQTPEDNSLRIALANIENRLKNYSAAESLLVAGIRINDDSNMRLALASFYVNQHDLAKNSNADLDVRIQHIQAALKFDQNHVPAYDRLISNYLEVESPERQQEIKGQLTALITDGKSPALSHFALSNVYWIEDDHEQAQWHMEQAYRHDSSFGIVANNLAWLLCHRDPPELERALDLIDVVVQQSPDDSRFRDTLGTILMKQEKYNLAAVELEKCLSNSGNKEEIHKKLAIIYDKLGRQKLARLHQQAMTRYGQKTR